MNTEKKNRKILSREISMYFSKELVYREQLVVWIIADIIKIVGLCFVWVASSRLTDDVTQGYVVTYYLLIMLISKLTTDYTMEYGVRDIVQGRFSNLLIKPFNYLLEYLGTNIGGNILRFIIFLPGFILGIYFANKYSLWILDFNPYNLFVALVAVIIGFFLSFLLGNIISLTAITIKEMDSIRTFYYNIASLLSGEFVPLIFLPLWGVFTLHLLPFRYTLSFPVEILIGGLNDYELQSGFVISIVWLVALFFLYKIIYALSIKKYESEGI
ncbi:MAG: ABC transporter permease [Candidatus Dojkabacteria bacterium]